MRPARTGQKAILPMVIMLGTVQTRSDSFSAEKQPREGERTRTPQHARAHTQSVRFLMPAVTKNNVCSLV